jgi:hypothetical protein
MHLQKVYIHVDKYMVIHNNLNVYTYTCMDSRPWG